MSRIAHRLSSRDRSERGAVVLVAVVGIVLAMVSASLAVDLGSIANEKRLVQKIADMAALDASRDLPNAQAVAERSASRNNDLKDSMVVVPGVNPKAVLGVINPVTKQFVPQAGGSMVQVTAVSTVSNYFPFVAGPHSVTGVAVAGFEPEAAFSVGSTLAALDSQKTLLDPILGNMLGGATALNMSAVGYNALASGNVSLAALQTNLVNMGYDVGTTDKLLANSVRVSDLLRASALALTASGNSAAAAAVNDIPLISIPNASTVNLGRLVSLSQPGNASALETTFNVFQMLTGAASVANGSSFVSIPGVVVNVPGTGTVRFELKLIEPPQTARGPVGVQAKTSQVVLRLKIDLLPVLPLGPPVALDLDFTAASANGTLTAINCSVSPSITVGLTTNGATVTGGAALGSGLGSLVATGSLAAGSNGSLTFNYPSQFVPPVGSPGDPDGQRVSGATLDLSPAVVTITGTGLTGATTAAAVQPLIPAILTAVDAASPLVLQPVLRALGMDLAAADVTALGIYEPPPACGVPGLVR
ncbi:MAG: hypothetical protein ACR2KK_00305 [Acidimicrobiales bacterium]